MNAISEVGNIGYKLVQRLGGAIAIRKWWGKAAGEKPLTGHHIGIYGQIFTYDFETGGRGYMGGKPGGTLWDKMNYIVGAEYGYSLPIARRLNIDFTIGAAFRSNTSCSVA